MAIGTGHLEPLIPLEVDSSTFNWVLGVPNIRLATAIVYSMFDQMTEPELDMQHFRKRRSHCLSVNWGTKDSFIFGHLTRQRLGEGSHCTSAGRQIRVGGWTLCWCHCEHDDWHWLHLRISGRKLSAR